MKKLLLVATAAGLLVSGWKLLPKDNNEAASTPVSYETNRFDVTVIDVQVHKLIDGDSLVLKGPKGTFEARVVCIDAYEYGQGEAYDYGHSVLSKLVSQGNLIAVIHGEDSYGRKLVSLRNGNGDIGEQMVLNGAALPYMDPNIDQYEPPNTEYMSYCNNQKYRDALNSAEAHNRGVFGRIDMPVQAPWHYR